MAIRPNQLRDEVDVLDDLEPDSVAVDWQSDCDALIDIEAAMRRLPTAYRGIMWAFYMEDLTVPEIVARFRLSRPTVNRRLRDGREMIRAELCV